MDLKSVLFLSRFQLQKRSEYADNSNACRNVRSKGKGPSAVTNCIGI